MTMIVVDVDGEPGDGVYLYAWVAVTKDTVGIVSIDIGLGGPTPMVMQRRDLAERLRPKIEQLAAAIPGKWFELRRYSMAEILERLP